MASHLTAKGEHIDMDRLRSIHATMPALGNANKNARGDLLGPGGVILKTQEQISAEIEAIRAERAASIRPVDIKSPALIPDNPQVGPVPTHETTFNDQEFDSVVPVKKQARRKIIEPDE